MDLANFLLFFCLIYETHAMVEDVEKVEFCSNIQCEHASNNSVCGMREEGKGLRLRLFKNECELMKFGCKVEEEDAFGLINKEYCERAFSETGFDTNAITETSISDIFTEKDLNLCAEYDCTSERNDQVCGLREDGAGFRIRIFRNKCELKKHNCETKLQFSVSEFYYCASINHPESAKQETSTQDVGNEIYEETTQNEDLINKLDETIKKNENTETKNSTNVTEETTYTKNKLKLKNLIILDDTMLNFNGNINETMDNFFASTHVLDLPLKTLDTLALDSSARRMLLKIAGPVKVFQPSITIPKNVAERSLNDSYKPTLSSCFHKCPTECPDTYAPVCGVPGISAREPSLMFKNHCFMDVAQCKMRNDKIGDTYESSSYIENSFLVCLGDVMMGVYRFMPLIRTLQRMGRLKKKGRFHYKLRNMRFNNFALRNSKVMG